MSSVWNYIDEGDSYFHWKPLIICLGIPTIINILLGLSGNYLDSIGISVYEGEDLSSLAFVMIAYGYLACAVFSFITRKLFPRIKYINIFLGSMFFISTLIANLIFRYMDQIEYNIYFAGTPLVSWMLGGFLLVYLIARFAENFPFPKYENAQKSSHMNIGSNVSLNIPETLTLPNFGDFKENTSESAQSSLAEPINLTEPFFCQIDQAQHPASENRYRCTLCSRYMCESCYDSQTAVGLTVCSFCKGKLELFELKQDKSTSPYLPSSSKKDYLLYGFLHPQVVLKKFLGYLVSSILVQPNSLLDLIKDVDLSVQMHPFYFVHYDLETEFTTTTGRILKSIDLESFLIIDAVIEYPVHYYDDKLLSKFSSPYFDDSNWTNSLSQVLLGQKVDLASDLERQGITYLDTTIKFNSADPADFPNLNINWISHTLTPVKAKKLAVKEIRGAYTQTIDYQGMNQLDYSREFKPKRSDIDINDLSLVYIPRWLVQVNILNYLYQFRFVINNDLEFFIHPSPKCLFCSRPFPNVICVDCGKIVHKKESITCITCQKVICPDCGRKKRRKVIFSDGYCNTHFPSQRRQLIVPTLLTGQ